MILEMAILEVRPGSATVFQRVLSEAERIIAGTAGHFSHGLHRCTEDRDQFLLLVGWDTIEDHTVGFRGSAGYQRWRGLLHHFYEPFPEILHYELVSNG